MYIWQSDMHTIYSFIPGDGVGQVHILSFPPDFLSYTLHNILYTNNKHKYYMYNMSSIV